MCDRDANDGGHEGSHDIIDICFLAFQDYLEIPLRKEC